MTKLKNARRDINKIRNTISELVQYESLQDTCTAIAKILLTNIEGKLDPRDKINDIILIGRLCYPFGINMKNPDINEVNPETISEVSYDAKNTLKLFLSPKNKDPIKIIIKPRANNTIISINQPNSGEGEIANGQGMLLGRRLSLRNILGLKLDISIKTRLEYALSKTKDQKYNDQVNKFSRGGMLVVRLNNRIFLFDRGAFNPMEIVSTNYAESGSYMPNTLIDNNTGTI